MSNNLNWNNPGEQIKDALSEALSTGDFRELNNLVSQTVTTAISEMGKHTSSNNSGTQSSSFDYRNSQSTDQGSSEEEQSAPIPLWQQRAQERARKKQAQVQQDWENRILQRYEQIQQQNSGQSSILSSQTELAQSGNAQLPAVKMRKVGKVSNVLYQVFGGIGLGITGFITLIRLFVFLAGDTTPMGWIVNFAFLAFFYGMIKHGIGQKERLKRAIRYVQLCGHKMYADIENLARSMGKNVNFVLKDLRKMLDLGIFPEGHLDEQKTCLMLNDTIYQQYLETEDIRRHREMERIPERVQEESRRNKETQTSTEAQQPSEALSEEESELNTMIAEGMEGIRKLRDLNDRIPGEVISAKLFRMENLLKDIFDSLKEHPEQMHRMHKLMSYYLPTTIKLVEAYEDFNRVSTPGKEILQAKAEIENTLDTINQAFSELLNNLFQDTVFDVTTDAQVLKSMLVREGLMREMELVPNSQEQKDSPQAQYFKE